jgi:hypothetical protein
MMQRMSSSNIYASRAALWELEDVLDESLSGAASEERAPPIATQVFTLFPNLAFELREMIW